MASRKVEFLTLHGMRTLAWVVASGALGPEDGKRYIGYSRKSEACFLYNREFGSRRHEFGARMERWASANSPSQLDLIPGIERGQGEVPGPVTYISEDEPDAPDRDHRPPPGESYGNRARAFDNPETLIVHEKRSAPKRSYTIYWVGDKRFQSWKRASEFVASLNPTQHDTSPGVQNAAMAPSPFAHSIMGCYQQFIAVDVAVPRKDHVANNTCLGVAAVDLHRLKKANIDLQRIRTIRGQLWTMAQKLSEEPECEHSRKLQDQYRAEMALELGLKFINGVADYAPELQEIQEQLSSTLYPNF